MKKIAIILFFFHFFCLGTKRIIENEFGVSGKTFKQLIAKRFYFVQRLSRLIEIVKKLEQIEKKEKKLYFNDSFFSSLHDEPFKHLVIKNALQDAKKIQSLDPLLYVWHEFSSFKALNDTLFVQEFTKVIFIISSVLSKKIKKSSLKKDLLCSFVHNSCYKSFLEQSVDAEILALRFYILKRLAVPIEQIKSFILKNNKNIDSIKFLNDIIGKISSPLLKKTIEKVVEKQSFLPLVSLWQEVEHYGNVYNGIFLKELLICIATVQYSIISFSDISIRKTSFENYQELYNLLNKLPLKEILDVIDLCTKDLEPLLIEYELRSNMSWSTWMKKYWWLAPVLTSFVVVKLLKLYVQIKNSNSQNMLPKTV